MTARLIDHLCDMHLLACQERWPIAGNFGALLDECHRCHRIADRLHPSGSYFIRVLPDLDNRTYGQGDATHEAAHAVTGLLARMPLNYARVMPRLDTPQDSDLSHVNWGDYSTPIEEWAAMCWAGPIAHRRWLVEIGQDTRANLYDLVNMGWSDAMRVYDAAAEHGLPRDIGWDLAGELVDRYWLAIERVADALLTAGRLSGEEIAAIAGITCNA